METEKIIQKNQMWHEFCKVYSLDEKIQQQYQRYADLLVSENKKYNLTALTKSDDIINYHFDDSLRITQFIDLKTYTSIADVGTGCGVPGIILACAYPASNFYLIETINKRIHFLEKAIAELELVNCTIVQLDFKTYVRKGLYPSDLFLSRASLSLPDLLFLYSGNSCYQQSELVYWGSSRQDDECIFPKHRTDLECTRYPYEVGDRVREYAHVHA